LDIYHAVLCCGALELIIDCACIPSKSKAALKKMKFPPELDLPVDYDKVCYCTMPAAACVFDIVMQGPTAGRVFAPSSTQHAKETMAVMRSGSPTS